MTFWVERLTLVYTTRKRRWRVAGGRLLLKGFLSRGFSLGKWRVKIMRHVLQRHAAAVAYKVTALGARSRTQQKRHSLKRIYWPATVAFTSHPKERHTPALPAPDPALNSSILSGRFIGHLTLARPSTGSAVIPATFFRNFLFNCLWYASYHLIIIIVIAITHRIVN